MAYIFCDANVACNGLEILHYLLYCVCNKIKDQICRKIKRTCQTSLYH